MWLTRFSMRAMMVLASLIQLTTPEAAMAGDWGPYITPGIKLGWDSQRGFTMGPKLGIGLVSLDRGQFINFTIGIKAFENHGERGNEYVFLDCQFGTMVPGATLLSGGGGVGLMFGVDDAATPVVPRMMVFVGFIAFANLDFTFWGEDDISHEPGAELLLPVPLFKVDLGFD